MIHVGPPTVEPKGPRCVVGVDLAQSADFTCFTFIEWQGEGDAAIYAVRHIDRFRGQPYTAVARRLGDLVGRLLIRRPRPDVTVVVDATGVGAAALDVMRETDIAAPLVPVLIHGGDRVLFEDGVYRVPKRDLIATVQVAMEAKRLRINPDFPFASILTDELSKFRWKTTPTGRDAFEAWREDDHDDAVLSVALGLWWGCYQDRNPPPAGYSYSYLGDDSPSDDDLGPAAWFARHGRP